MEYTLADKTVGVMGSGKDAHEPLPELLAELLVELKVNLLTGGGQGVMEAVSKKFRAAQVRQKKTIGIIIGILRPESLDDGKIKAVRTVKKDYLDLSIRTHLPFSGDKGTDTLSRNHINALTPDVMVALPGGGGTASEVTLALRYGTPVIVFAPDRAAVANFPDDASHAGTIEEVRAFLEKHLRRVPGRERLRG